MFTAIPITTTLLSKTQQWLERFTRDGRHPQIFFLAVFLIYGVYALGWSADIPSYIIFIGFCLLAQGVGIFFTTKNYSGLKSALISSFSLCLMLKGNMYSTLAIAAILSIAGKYLIRYKGKHIFNPTNFGIALTILITGDAWLSPGQWGSDVVMMFLVFLGGASMLLRVGRFDSALSFIIVFSGLHFIKQVLYLGWEIDFFIHHLSSGTLLLFTFFMITDPITTPSHRKARIIWAGLVGLLAFVMNSWFYLHTAPIWALFIISPLTAYLDRTFVAKKFTWKTN